MAEAIDNASSKEWNPGHLNQPHSQTPSTKKEEIGDEGEGRTQQTERLVDSPFDHVVRRALSVLFDEGLVVRSGVVERGTPEHHAPDAINNRAVRILVGIDIRVMASVNRDPFARRHRRPDPQPESHEMFDRRVERNAAMGLATMQIEGDASRGDVRVDEGEKGVAPNRQIWPKSP